MNLVSMFDLYGRFALHREALKCNGGPISFSEQAQHVLFWISFDALPSLQRITHQSEQTDDTVPPFTDPDLSLIQIEKSFNESTMLSPQSPQFMVRPRRRANRNKTPERLDEGVGIFDDTPGPHVSKSINQKVIHGMIIALFNSTCLLLSEWLVVGGSVSETTITISEAASEWCDILANLPLRGKSNVSPAISDGILTPFLRLTGQLVLTSGSCENLKQALTKLCNFSTCSDEVSDNLRKTLSAILTKRGKHSVQNDLVRCFLDSSYEIVKEETASLKCRLPESFDEIFGTHRSCFLRPFFYAILSHQQACFELTDTLVERCPEHLKDNAHHRLALFDLQCLWLVLNVPKANTKLIESVGNMVRQLDTTLLNDDLQLVIEEFKLQASIETGNQ
jgi:hypothetical protein